MEETLGKRIALNRKKLGMTQDQLADKLGVTAQAVSKWENDQSCPDIATLPKLADIFGTTTDQLLGMEKNQPIYEAEVVQPGGKEDAESDGIHIQKGNWDFRWDNGRRGALGFALWVLLVGGLMLASSLLDWNVSMWDIMWPSAMLMIGLTGLLNKFTFLNLGLSCFGGYFLLNALGVIPFSFGKEILLPVFIILFGLSLLADALRRPKHKRFSVIHNDKHRNKGEKFCSNCTTEGESFTCSTSFGEDTKYVCLPRLSSGTAEVSFGELTVDLSGCESVSDDCHISANCAFGELNLRVPRHYRVELASDTAFASVEEKGFPDASVRGVISVSANASFGSICICYV